MCTHIRGTQVNSIKKLNVVLGHLQNFEYSADKSDLLRAKSVFFSQRHVLEEGDMLRFYCSLKINA